MKVIFSEFGWLKEVVIDNGFCYSVEYFKIVMKERGVKYSISFFYYV